MEILRIFGIIYLILGFLYATYIFLFAWDEWYKFPINLILGPLVMVLTGFEVIRKDKHRKF